MSTASFDETNYMYRRLIHQFGSIRCAAKALGFHWRTLYFWIDKNNITIDAQFRIRDAGYNPKTFTPI